MFKGIFDRSLSGTHSTAGRVEIGAPEGSCPPQQPVAVFHIFRGALGSGSQKHAVTGPGRNGNNPEKTVRLPPSSAPAVYFC
jgi:hypothetical protein